MQKIQFILSRGSKIIKKGRQFETAIEKLQNVLPPIEIERRPSPIIS